MVMVCMFVLTDGDGVYVCAHCVYVCSPMVMVCMCVLTDGDGVYVCAH